MDQNTRIIKKRYIFMAAIMILAGLGLITIPNFDKMKETEAKQMLLESMSHEKSISTDKVAEMIIGKNPLLQLIDVRSPEEFQKYSLPGAINIPLEDLFAKEQDGSLKWGYIINQKTKLNVFFSNGDIYSTRAWFLCTRLKFTNNYTMQGGLNYWFKTIIQPEKPTSNSTVVEDDLYEFRLGARQYFLGGKVSSKSSSQQTESSTPVIKKKTNAGSGGGC